jgi:hypothetical protein
MYGPEEFTQKLFKKVLGFWEQRNICVLKLNIIVD